MLSLFIENNIVTGTPHVIQPVLFIGNGKINFGEGVSIGCRPSPYLYSGYTPIEARKQDSVIRVGDNVWMNNSYSLISEEAGIEIG